MLRFLIARFKQGHRTAPFPRTAPTLPDRFRGMPSLDPTHCPDGCRECVRACPTDAIAPDEFGLKLDLGRCLFCTDCAEACPEGAIGYTTEYRLAARQRQDLVTHGQAFPRAAALEGELRRLFRRSLKLRVVSAAGCNACEADVNVLGTPVFDLGRFGIQYVASPRHADGLLITGPVSENMKLALKKTYDAVPPPKIVIAVGACAISGGPYINHSEVSNGADNVVPVDLYIPGCPPHPYTILDGLLRLLGRIDEARISGATEQVRSEIEAETVRWGTERARKAAEQLGAGPRPASPTEPPKS